MIGWIATAIMLYGSFLVGERNKTGFLCQLAGNAMWAYVGVTRGMQVDLIVVSLAFVVLYVRNYRAWCKSEKTDARPEADVGRASVRSAARSQPLPCD